MFSRIIISALFLVLAMAPLRPANAEWMNYQHDAQHTSKADAAGPSDVGIKWSYQHPDEGNGSAFTAGIAIGPDGTIYTGGEDGRGYALNPNGSIKHIFEDVGLCCAPPVVDGDGNVYFSGNALQAYDADYNLKWVYPDGGSCCGALSVGPDGTIYVGNGWLHALDPNPTTFVDPEAKTVAPKWDPFEYGNWSPAVSLYNSTVYITDMETLYAVNPATGSPKWHQVIHNDLETTPVIAYINDNGVSKEIVYVPDDRKLIAIDTSQIGNEETPPVSAVTTVYEFTDNRQVGAMAYDEQSFTDGGTLVFSAYGYTPDPETGEKAWDADGLLYSVNAANGATRWAEPKFISGSYGGPIATSPQIDSEGSVFLVSNDYDSPGGVDFMTHIYKYDMNGNAVFEYSTPLMYHTDARQSAISDTGDLYVLMDGAIKDFSPVADIAVFLMATPNPVNSGGALTVTAILNNAGPDVAKNAKLKVILPSALSNVSVISGPAACTVANTTITCPSGDLDAERAIVVIITATAGGAPATVNASALGSTTTYDPNTSNNYATLPIIIQ